MKENISHQILPRSGTFPNNPHLPAVIYHDVADFVLGKERDPAFFFETLFSKSGWRGSWRNGVYNIHHYHSNAHEVLGCYSGAAEIQLGGPDGPVFDVQCGDIVVIPAGVAHFNAGSTADFGVVGAYPDGRRPDMRYGTAEELEKAIAAIAEVPLPTLDPADPTSGALQSLWNPE